MQGPDREIAALCSDSRQVVPGALFVAVKGYASDGHAYIASAIEKGAVAIAYEDADAVAAAMKKSGADASVNSIPYQGPFTLTETATIKAVAVKDDVVSYQASAFYKITDEENIDDADDEGDEVAPADGTILLCDDFFGTSYGGPISSSKTEDLTGTANGVAVVYSLAGGSNRYVNSEQIRLYPGNTLTFSVSQGNITALEFEFTTGTPSQSLTVSGTSLTDGKWTGSSKNVNVSFGGSSKHARISGVKVSVAGGATGIDAVNTSLDGQRVVYNLRGQRVAHPTKGMYIVDGKKIMIE